MLRKVQTDAIKSAHPCGAWKTESFRVYRPLLPLVSYKAAADYADTYPQEKTHRSILSQNIMYNAVPAIFRVHIPES